MGRVTIDCRDYPADGTGCTLSLSADTPEELLKAAVKHGTEVHGYTDGPELREELKKGFKEG